MPFPDTADVANGTGLVVDRANFSALFDVLQADGYAIVGPTIGDQAIVYDELASVEDLPIGWADEQDGGEYRIRRRGDDALFGYVVGPHSWKKYLFPPRSELVTVRSANGSLEFLEPDLDQTRYAFLGVRACELAAIAMQDQVFLKSGFRDRTYQANRSRSLVIAVNCAVGGGTCFCLSMKTGPRCTAGYDLVMTEVIDGDVHEFVIEAGTDQGLGVLERLPGRPLDESDRDRVDQIVTETASNMGRALDTDGIKELLYDNLEHARWDEVAERCLACANCTMVCPTCFCSTTEDFTALDATSATRTRSWDSCFTLDFSSLHQIPVRHSTASRYRQWLTHKLATWLDQFGTSGCVGCGRCITWCPVGIDITEEMAAIRGGQS
jgi:ferredoxin